MRGDLARSIFYMAARYHGSDEALKLSDCPCQYEHTMGKLSALMSWHEMDPPSMDEVERTKTICASYQRNRNPFIDFSDLARAIFDNTNYSRAMFNRSSIDEGCVGDGTDMNDYCIETGLTPTSAPTPAPVNYNLTTPCMDSGSLAVVGFNTDDIKQIAIVVLKDSKLGKCFISLTMLQEEAEMISAEIN